jgi:hypothetical protein
MADMGMVSRAIDKLPAWARAVFIVFAIAFCVYDIVHYGFFSFLIHLIFSPTP